MCRHAPVLQFLPVPLVHLHEIFADVAGVAKDAAGVLRQLCECMRDCPPTAEQLTPAGRRTFPPQFVVERYTRALRIAVHRNITKFGAQYKRYLVAE